MRNDKYYLAKYTLLFEVETECDSFSLVFLLLFFCLQMLVKCNYFLFLYNLFYTIV